MNQNRYLDSSELFKGISFPTEGLVFKKFDKTQAINVNTKDIGVIVKGIVEVYQLLPDGYEIHLSTLKENETFGISTIFSEEAMTTTLKCRGGCEICFINKDIIVKMMKENGDLAFRFVMLYNTKVDFLLRRIKQLTMPTALKKIAAYLVEENNDLVIMMHHRDKLASYLGMSRASFYRELTYLKNRHIVSVADNQLVIKDIKALEKIYYQ